MLVCSLSSANYFMGSFPIITEATGHYYSYFTDGKAQMGRNACPSHVDYVFRVEFQFLDLLEARKIYKYILKDSMI